MKQGEHAQFSIDASRGTVARADIVDDQRSHIELVAVGKTFRRANREVHALQGVDFAIEAGSFVSIVGRSGSGKSTLLRLLGGLARASTGRVALDDQEVLEPPNDARIVFQNYAQSLLPWTTIEGNVALGVAHHCDGIARNKRDRLAEAKRLLELVGLDHARGRYPWELSGGMQQRVAIARALASQPRVLLMDEPFSSVDALSRAQLQDVILDIWTRLRTTIIFVTHDIDEAVYLSDRVLVLQERGAGVLADIPVALPRPRDQVRTHEAEEYLRVRREIVKLVLQ